MSTVVRAIGAVVAGFVAASAVMMAVESLNGRVLYPELGKLAEGVTDRETLRGLLANAPVRYALILGALLTLAGIANNLMIPPPAWFWIPTLLVFVPSAFAGARLAPGGNVAST